MKNIKLKGKTYEVDHDRTDLWIVDITNPDNGFHFPNGYYDLKMVAISHAQFHLYDEEFDFDNDLVNALIEFALPDYVEANLSNALISTP